MAKSISIPILNCRRVKSLLKNTSHDDCATFSGPQNLSNDLDFLGAHILPYKYEKNLHLQVFSLLGITM